MSNWALLKQKILDTLKDPHLDIRSSSLSHNSDFLNSIIVWIINCESIPSAREKETAIKTLKSCREFICFSWSSIPKFVKKPNVRDRDYWEKLILLFLELESNNSNREDVLDQICLHFNRSLIVPNNFTQEGNDKIMGTLGVSTFCSWSKTICTAIMQNLPSIMTGAVLFHEVNLRYFDNSQWQFSQPDIFETMGDIMPIILFYAKHAPSNRYLHPVHIFKTMLFSCVLLGVRSKLLLRYAQDQNSFMHASLDAVGLQHCIQYIPESITSTLFNVETGVFLANLFPLVIYSMLCAEYSYTAGGALFFSVLQMLFLDSQRLPLFMQRQSIHEMIQQNYESESSLLGNNSWLSRLYSYFWYKTRDSLREQNVNMSLTKEVFTKMVYYHCFSSNFNFPETMASLSSAFTDTFPEFNMQLSSEYWRLMPSSWFSALQRQSSSNQQRLVKQRLRTDLQNLCSIYQPILADFNTVEGWISALTPSIRVLIQRKNDGISRMLSIESYTSSNWKRYIPYPHIITQSVGMSVESVSAMDMDISRFFIQNSNLTLQSGFCPNLVFYVHNIPFPRWSNGTELIANCQNFLQMTKDNPIIFEIFNKNYSAMQPWIPPRNFLIRPENASFRWPQTFASSQDLSLPIRFKLLLYIFLNQANAYADTIMDTVLDISPSNIVKEHHGQAPFFIPSLYTDSIFILMAMQTILPAVSSKIIDWLVHLNANLLQSVAQHIQDEAARRLASDAQYIFPEFFDTISRSVFLEACIIKYIDSHIMSSLAALQSEDWYVMASKEIYIEQLEVLFGMLPDIFSSRHIQSGWKFWFKRHQHDVTHNLTHWLEAVSNIEDNVRPGVQGVSTFWLLFRKQLISNHEELFRNDQNYYFRWMNQKAKPYLSSLMPWFDQNIFIQFQSLACFDDVKKHRIMRHLYKTNKSYFLSPFIRLVLSIDSSDNEKLRDWLILAVQLRIPVVDIEDAIDYILVVLRPGVEIIQRQVHKKLTEVIWNYFPELRPTFLAVDP